MGQYINTVKGNDLPRHGKAQFLIQHAGAKIVPMPALFTDNIVCVVDNGAFEAAGYCYSAQELEVFAYPDGRRKTWLIVPDAKELAA